MSRYLSVWFCIAALSALVLRAESGAVGPDAGSDVAKLPRVVLLVDEPDLEALLIAGLSEVETLGRTDLPKAVSEHALAGGDLRLANAEVVLVVTRNEGGGMARVVDCASGATVVALDLPVLPVEEAANWIVSRVRPFLGAIADPTRPRVSLTGLRFVTDSVENRATERAINLMLATRLQSGGALVLERWRMTDLVFEKSFGAVDSPFWRAAEVIDGSLSALAGTLSARVRIRSASGEERLIEAAGDTATELIDEIARQVLAQPMQAAIVSGGSVEADAFLVEARWMLAHGLQREAWQAAESALALGTEGRREARMLRARAAALCAFPGNLHGYASGKSYDRNAFPRSELPARMGMITEAILLAGDYWEDYVADAEYGWGPAYPPVLAYETLYAGLEILRIAQDADWSSRNAEAARGLRAAIRRIVSLVDAGLQGVQRQYYYSVLTYHAGYWNETPAEAVAFYRRMLDPHFDGGTGKWPERIRSRLTGGGVPFPPYLAVSTRAANFSGRAGPWRVPPLDEQDAREAWRAFLDELDRSTDVLSRADGLMLRWHSTADAADRMALTNRIVDFLAENTDALAGPDGGVTAGQMWAPLRDVGRLDGESSARGKAIGFFSTLLRSEAPLSPTVVRLIKFLFPTSSRAVADEEQGREMLTLLNVRRARPTISRQERVAIDEVAAVITARLPNLRSSPEVGDALVVRSLWIAGEHAPDGERARSRSFQSRATVWHDSRLWLLEVGSSRMWQVDPASGATNIFAATHQPVAGVNSQLVAWGGRFVMTTQDGVWVLDQWLRRWEKLNLPADRYCVGVVRGELWAGAGALSSLGAAKESTGTTIYRVSAELSCELVVSSRRRPAVHALDERLKGRPFALLPSGRGGLLIGTRGPGEIFGFFDTAGDEPFNVIHKRYVGPVSATGTPGLLMRRRFPHADRIGATNLELIDTEKDELLLSHPLLRNTDNARFAYPEDGVPLTATGYAAVWRDGGIDVLIWASVGSRQGAGQAWLMRVDEREGWVRPLRFEWSEGIERRVRTAGGSASNFHHPIIRPEDLLLTDQGLVVMGERMSGFWFIPNDDLARAGR